METKWAEGSRSRWSTTTRSSGPGSAELVAGVEVVGGRRRRRRWSPAGPHLPRVLLDVHMPEGGGVEVIRRAAPKAAESGEPSPLLALSVSDDPEDVVSR